jgi:hypothetical protein
VYDTTDGSLIQPLKGHKVNIQDEIKPGNRQYARFANPVVLFVRFVPVTFLKSVFVLCQLFSETYFG